VFAVKRGINNGSLASDGHSENTASVVCHLSFKEVCCLRVSCLGPKIFDINFTPWYYCRNFQVIRQNDIIYSIYSIYTIPM
jgi:hypothetical protein